MGLIVAGAATAVAASVLFSVGLVLQSLEARRVPTHHALRMSLVARLLGRPRWLLGTALAILGFPLHAAALLLAPFTVVQAALAAGLLVLLLAGARTPGERITRREVGGVVAIVAGVIGITQTAPPRTVAEADPELLAWVLGGLAALTLLLYATARVRHGRGRPVSVRTAVCAGTAYALSGLTIKLVTDELDVDDWLAAGGWLCLTVAANWFGFLGQLSALQERPATQVGPIIFVVPVIMPVLLAPLLLGEGWSGTPLGGLPLAASLAAVGLGATALSASPTVSVALTPEAPRPST